MSVQPNTNGIRRALALDTLRFIGEAKERPAERIHIVMLQPVELLLFRKSMAAMPACRAAAQGRRFHCQYTHVRLRVEGGKAIGSLGERVLKRRPRSFPVFDGEICRYVHQWSRSAWIGRSYDLYFSSSR